MLSFLPPVLRGIRIILKWFVLIFKNFQNQTKYEKYTHKNQQFVHQCRITLLHLECKHYKEWTAPETTT